MMTSREPGSTGVVLVVDDEEPMRFLMMELMRMEGHAVFEARDGVAAQVVLARHPNIDVVVTDLLMPELDGMGLLRWAQEHAPRPVWIINSGLDTFDAAAEAMDLGAFAFLPKTKGSIDALRATVRSALDRRELLDERERLRHELEHTNMALRNKVNQLEHLCRLLHRQSQTISEDLQRAEQLQSALLPNRAPELPGVSVQARHVACRHVGGDVYDVVRLDDDHMAFYVADAAGHGVSAAMLSVLFKLRLRMRHHTTDAPLSPAVVLTAANQAVLDACRPQALFLTAAYGVLNLRTRELELASAGHPPLVLHRASGQTEGLTHTGPALGLSERAAYTEHKRVLEPEDRLLLYSDGLLVGGRTAEDLASALQQSAGVAADALQLLVAPLGEDDDVTALLLSMTDEPSHLENGERVPQGQADALPAATDAELLCGTVGETDVLCLGGSLQWTHSGAFLEACVSRIGVGTPVTLDLALCTHMDSTFLGTVHEVVTRAVDAGVTIHLQQAGSVLRKAFEELSMELVLEHVGPVITPIPTRMTAVPVLPPDVELSSHRVLEAHVALAALTKENAAEFADVVRALRGETRETP